VTSSDLLIVDNLGKCYRLYPHPSDRLKELFSRRRYHQEFWALKNVSFAVPKGASVGIVGENGAGKSTLLKLITGSSTPTTGTATVHGRVASIIELGMGFHPDFSGLENLFVGGALLGFSRKEMEAKVPEIAAFSELGEFLHRPLRNYSTGMGMRLSFSLAVSVEPDLLIVDEAFAVGDGHFQKKCIDRIRTFQEKNGSLLLCSHSLYTIDLLCQEAIWLREGRVEAFGPSPQVIAAYETYLNAREEKPVEQPWQGRHPGGELRSVRLLSRPEDGRPGHVQSGAEVCVEVQWTTDSANRLFHLGVAVDRVDNLTCFASSTLKDGLAPFTGKTSYRSILRFPALLLTNGSFRVKIFLLDEHGVHVYDHRAADPVLTIATKEKEWGICYLEHEWERESDTFMHSDNVLQVSK